MFKAAGKAIDLTRPPCACVSLWPFLKGFEANTGPSKKNSGMVANYMKIALSSSDDFFVTSFSFVSSPNVKEHLIFYHYTL